MTGICFAEDWTEEQEESGQIRFWLKTKICDLPPEVDWVVKYRVWQEEEAKAREDYND